MRRRSLRFRLLASSLALTLTGMFVINVVAVVSARDSLRSRVDQELLAVPVVSPSLTSRGGLPRVDVLPAQRLSSQFLNNVVVTLLDGHTGAATRQEAGPLLADAPRPDLRQVSAQISGRGAPSLDLRTVGGVGHPSYTYRIRVLPPAETGSDVIVIAQSLAEVRATVNRLVREDALLTLLVVAVLMGVGIPVIRVGLRPLTVVERAAERIRVGDLSARAPHSHDPTEVGSLARTFNAMVDQIEEHFAARQASEDQLRRFLADASHELRTPLTSIRAYAELFRHGVLPADRRSVEAMTRIESEATRMGLLVEDLLLLARLDQHPELDTAEVDLVTIVSEVVADTATAAPGHHISTRAGADRAVVVLGDERQLRQVVANLFRNAVVHTPEGTAVWASVQEETGTVRLVVSDQGPGMTAETAAHVFDRFYRADPGGARATTGSGLGLAIVKSIVTAHDGEVQLDTAPGKGARFTVVLPAARLGAGKHPGPSTANLRGDDRTP